MSLSLLSGRPVHAAKFHEQALLLFLLSFALPGSAQPADESAKHNHFFPLILDGGGFQTILFLANISGAANRCELDLRGPDLDAARLAAHADVASAGSRASIFLAAESGSLMLTSAGEDALASGYGIMECAGPVSARMLLAQNDADALSGLTAIENASSGHRFQLPVLSRLGQSYLVFSNDNYLDAACAVELTTDGAAAAGGGNALVAANSTDWRPLADLVSIPDEWDEGIVALSCDREISALGFALRDAVFSTLPLIALDGHMTRDDNPAGESSRVLPLVIDGDGFRSRLLATNLTDAPNRCRVELRGAGLDSDRFAGADATASGIVLEFARQGDQRLLSSNGDRELAFGHAIFECDGAVDVRNLLSASVRGDLAGMASLSGSQGGDGFEFPAVPQAGRLALALSNAGASEAACELALQGHGGEDEGRRRVALPARSTVVRFFADLFDRELAGFAGGMVTASCDAKIDAVSLPLSGAAFAALAPVISSLPAASPQQPDPGPAFGDTSLNFEIYRIDQAISPLQLPAASGGKAPLRYSLEPEVPGLRFDPETRQLKGTPTTSGQYEMIYRVEDADGHSDTHRFGIVVEGPDTRPGFSSTLEDQTWLLGETIETLQLPEAVGGNEPIWYFLRPQAPPGVRFDPETRQLAGAPSKTGVYRMTYSAVDVDADMDVLAFSITVKTPAASGASLLEESGCSDGAFVDDPDANAGLVADCRALVGFANALIETDLHVEDNVIRQWGRGDRRKLESWRGIGISDGRVDSIDLGSSDLKGDFPSGLGRLSALKALNLESNQLTGAIPLELGDLSRLKLLNLSRNRLRGVIPRELGRLGALEVLKLGANQLTGAIPPELGDLSRLRSLEMYLNQLDGAIPPELGRLGALEVLNLGWNKLTGAIPPELGDLSRLQRLDLGSNQLTGAIPPELGRLGKLTWLSLGSNELANENETAIPVQGATAAPTRTGSRRQQDFMQPEISVNKLSGGIPREIGELVELEFLYLSGNQLSGALPEWLNQLDKLKTLDVRFNTSLHGTVPWSFRERLQSNKLNLLAEGTQISGFAPAPAQVGNPASSPDAADASWRSTAYFQGPLVLERNREGEQIEYQTPILGRWAALAVRVDHAAQQAPRVITRVLDAGDKVLAEALAESAPAVTEAVGAGRWRTEYVFHLPGELFQAGNRIVHVVGPDEDPAGTDGNDNATRPFVIFGARPPAFRATFIPINLSSSDAENTGWEEALDPDALMRGTLAFLPIADDYEARIGPPLASESQDINGAFSELIALWNMEAEPDEFYHGIIPSRAGGVALLKSRVAVSDMSIHGTIPHEFGHNFSLEHAPGCHAIGIDDDYPYPDGQLGLSRGWDRSWSRFISRATAGHTDMMSYCGEFKFISAYNYRLATEYWLSRRDDADRATTTAALARYDIAPASASGTGSGASARRAAAPAHSGSLAFSGRISAGGAWRLTQATLSGQAPRPAPDAGEFTLILFDGAGVRMYAEPLSVLSPSAGGESFWFARTPLPLRAARAIVIRNSRGEEVLRETLPTLQ